MFRRLKSSKKAFSLIELALVLLIIGIMVSGILNASSLVRGATMYVARSLTVNSPVNKISDLIFWQETSNKYSFAVGTSTYATQEPPSDGQIVGVWNNINAQISKEDRPMIFQSNDDFQPKYIEYSINNLPSIRFDGNDFMRNNQLTISGMQMTLFVVSQRSEYVADASVVSGKNAASIDDTNSYSFVGFQEYQMNKVKTFRVSDQANSESFPNLDMSTPHIYVTAFDNLKNYMYIDGIPTNEGQLATVARSFYIEDFIVGCRVANKTDLVNCYKGDVSEIIVFRKFLTDLERKSVEKYLSKKYKIQVAN